MCGNGTPRWLQISIRPADPRIAESVLTSIGSHLRAAGHDRVIADWFFIRKRPWLRIRYHPHIAETQARQRITEITDRLHAAGLITAAGHGVYEPEYVAFGGAAGMAVAHRFFADDTEYITTYLACGNGGDPRRELTLLLCASLMRAAGQEWYEQGDIWAQIAANRGAPPNIADRPSPAAATVRRFLTADPRHAAARLSDVPADLTAGWLTVFQTIGSALRQLADQGQLTRGLRAVICHCILFHWNRLGIPATHQRHLAHAAAEAVFTTHTNPHTRPTGAKSEECHRDEHRN